MKFAHILLLIAVIGMVLNIDANPGLYTAINADGVTRLVNKVLPPLFEQVKHAQFPEVHDGHHHITGVHIPELGVSSFAVAADPSGVIVLNIQQFYTEVNMHYRYKRKLFRVSANVRVRIGDGYFHFHLRLLNRDGRFGLEVAHVAIDAGEASVKISGGLVAKFINAVKSLFKSRIKHAIIDAIRAGVQGGLSGFADAFVNKIPLSFAIADWGLLDLSLATHIGYVDNRLIIGFNGEIKGADHSPSDAERHNVPFHPSGKLFDITLDTFVFNSLFKTFFKKGLFHHVCTQDQPNGFSFVPLNTKEWGEQGLQKLSDKHPNSPIALVLAFRDAPVITSNGGHAGFQAVVSVSLQVQIGNDYHHVFRIDINQTASATAAIIDRRIVPQITNLETQLTLADSTIGDFSFDIAVIQTLVNFANGIASSVINERLLQGIPLPVTDNFALSDVSLVFPENGLSFGCDIDFHV